MPWLRPVRAKRVSQTNDQTQDPWAGGPPMLKWYAIETNPQCEVRAKVAETLAALTEKDTFARFRANKPNPPCARVDDTGVSPEMRALLEDR